jgi:anti-anti-sigma factor
MLKPMVKVRQQDGVLVAEFWDCLRLDPAPVQDLRKLFDDHVRGGGRPDLVIDLNGVTFAGSASLGGFLALRKLSHPAGGRIVFCNVDPNVKEVFRVSQIARLFAFADDLPGALARVDEPPGASSDEIPTFGSPATPAAPRPSPGLLRRRKPI